MRHMQGWRGSVAATAVLAACANGSPAPEITADVGDACVVATPLTRLTGLPEASGLTLSRRTPGLLWSHNDSGEPTLVAFDTTGGLRGRVRVANAAVEDWEDIASVSCPRGDCLLVADMGDNDRVRRGITLYRVAEPDPDESRSAPAEAFAARYPDGAHDAEALFAAGDDLFILTKGEEAVLYRFPQPLRTGEPMTLERLGTLSLELVTGANTSSDGAWVAVRTNERAMLYRTAELLRAATAAAGGRIDVEGMTVALEALGEPQGEGIALDGEMLYLASEGGGGRFSALRCTLPPS